MRKLPYLSQGHSPREEIEKYLMPIDLQSGYHFGNRSEKEVHVRQSELFRLVEEFLNDRLSNQKCDRCGSPMQHLEGQFLLYKTVLKWDMGLPFCSRCDEAMEACFHRINGIAAKAKAADSENTA